MISPDDQPARDAALDDVAAEWLCEQEEGFAPARERAFTAWLAQDPRHAAAVTRVERTLALLDEMPEARAPLEARFGATEGMGATVVTSRGLSFPRWAMGLAAVLVLGMMTWWLAASRLGGEERFAADAQRPRRVNLRDGSIVDIKAGSEIRVRFSAAERDIALTAGEAHFQVAHDTARPFIVSAGGVAVRAVGTAFNVRLAPTAVDVLVVEGKVEVAPTAAAAPSVPVEHPRVAAGEKVQFSRETSRALPPVQRAAPEEIRATLAWQNPLTTFTDVPLREVVIQFNRRNVRQLLIDDATLGERRIGGVIALDQVEAFVRLLEQDGDVVSEPRGENAIALRRAR